MTGNLLSTFDDVLTSVTNLNEFISKLEYFADHKEEIEKATRGQSDNTFWFSARKHCITASKAHDVMSRMVTYKSNLEETNFNSVMDKVSGKTHLNMDLPVIKYDQAIEEEAVCKDVPFVGACPDRIILCDCFGESCLEVKCPFSISHTSPTDPNVRLPYLMLNEDSTVMLNRKHKYSTQCQVQMAATEMTRIYLTILVTLPGIHCFVHEGGEGFTQTSSLTENELSTSQPPILRLTSNGTLQRFQNNQFEGTELSSVSFRGVTLYQNLASSGVIPPRSAILLIVW